MSIYGRLRPTGLLSSLLLASSAPPYTDCTVASTAPGHQRLLQLKHSPTPCVFSVVEEGTSVRRLCTACAFHSLTLFLCALQLINFVYTALSQSFSLLNQTSHLRQKHTTDRLSGKKTYTHWEKKVKETRLLYYCCTRIIKKHFFASDTEDTGRRLMTAI